MRRPMGILFLTCLASLGLAACGEPSPEAQRVQEKLGETWDATKEWGAAQREALEKKVSEGLRDMEPALADAKARAGEAGTDAARAIESAWQTAQEKLAALKRASGPAAAKARDELVAAYEALRAKLSNTGR